jgi:DnaJ-class molecular chaperone
LEVNNCDLTVDCALCNATGEVDDAPCDTCEGYGHFLAQNGAVLIEFLASRGVAFPMSSLAEDELRRMAEDH